MTQKIIDNVMKRKREKRRVLAIPADGWACGYYRIYQPYNLINRINDTDIEFEVFDIELFKSLEVRKLLEYDAVVIQRPTHKLFPRVVEDLQKHGVKFVVETDDLLTNIAPTNPCFQYYKPGSEAIKNFISCVKNANAVHTSTDELTEEMKKYNKNVHTFNNGIDLRDKKYAQKLPRIKKNGEDVNVPIVMWAGSSTHLDSLQIVKTAVENVIKRNDAIFALCGNREFYELFDIPEDKKVFIQPVKMELYPQIPSYADIFLTPVTTSPFNNSKSELKVIEAGVFGVPSVSSPVAPYERFNRVSDGANLIAKKNKVASWEKEIERLVVDEKLRIELGEKTKKAVDDFYDIDKINQKRLEFWKEFLK